jgi:spermidine synthase
MAQVQRCLEPKKGIFCTIATPIRRDLEKSKKELAAIGKNFWICMPYNFDHTTLIFASKKYHPQAEIVLQVSDLLADCNYYSTEMQNAVFVYPTYITKAITGIAKR